MPYISTETVRRMRQELRKRFPQFKLSVKRDRASTVSVTIQSGPIDFGVKYSQINHYYITEHWSGEAGGFLQSVYNTINSDLGEGVYDGDYGVIPTYYTRINVGSWDKGYIVTS